MAGVNVFALIVFSGLVGSGAWIFWTQRRISPVFWFLPLQWLIGAGTIWMLDLTVSSDRVYLYLFLIAQVSFTGGALLFSLHLDLEGRARRFWAKPLEDDSQETRILIWLILSVGIAVTVAYYRAVGYNLFGDILTGRAIEDFTSARLAAYSGVEYFAPGYANQFKNVLVPLCFSVIIARAWYSGYRRRGLALLAVGIPFCLYALLGTGQRAFLVYAFCSLLFGIAATQRLRTMNLTLAGAAVVLAFGVLSFQLGRIETFDTAAILLEVVSRLVVNDQEGGLVGFRFVFGQDVVWLKEWGTGFLGLLPGHSGSTMAHDVFEIMHGTRRGTANLTTVASVYHNLGAIGSSIFYGLLGATYTLLFYRFLGGRRTLVRSFSYGALFFHLAFFVTSAPVALINKGALTILIVLGLRRIRIRP